MVRAVPTLEELTAALPPRIWYLTSNGKDMWCRRPYSFWFSTGEAAEQFATAMGSEYGLFAVGYDTTEVLAAPSLDALRELSVTRIFIDPAIDPDTGDVTGTILRLSDMN